MASVAEIKAGAAYVELVLRDKLQAQLAAAGAKLKAWGNSISGIGMKAFGGSLPGPVADVLRMAMSPAGAFAGFQAAAKSFADSGAAMLHAARATGMTVEAFSALKYAAEAVDVPVEALQGGIVKMQRSLVDAARGGAAPNEALLALGLTIDQLNRMTPEQQFTKIADGIDKIKDPALRAASVLGIFGRGGAELLPLLQQGGGGIRGLVAEAQRLGFVMGGPAAKAAEELHRKFQLVARVTGQITRAVGQAVAVMQGQMLDRVLSVLFALRDWIKANPQLVAGVAKMITVIVAAGGALVLFGGALSAIGTMFTFLATAMGAVISAVGIMLSPIGMLVGALAGVAKFAIKWEDFAKALDFVRAKAAWLFGFFKDSLGAIWNAMSAGKFDLAMAVLKTGFKALGRVLATYLYEAWLGIKNYALEQFGMIWAMVRMGANEALGWIEKRWIELKALFVNGFVDAIQAIYGALATVFARLAEGLSNSITAVLSAIPARLGGLSAEEAGERREEASNRAAEQIAGAKNVLANWKKTPAQIEKEKGKVDDATNQANADALVDWAKDNAKRNLKAVGALDPWKEWAREAWREWVNAWGAANAAKPLKLKGAAIKPAGLFDLDAAGGRLATAGTFSARAAEAMGQGGPIGILAKMAGDAQLQRIDIRELLDIAKNNIIGLKDGMVQVGKIIANGFKVQ